MEINQRVRDLREDMDLTQEDIAELLGVSRATVKRIEKKRP